MQSGQLNLVSVFVEANTRHSRAGSTASEGVCCTTCLAHRQLNGRLFGKQAVVRNTCRSQQLEKRISANAQLIVWIRSLPYYIRTADGLPSHQVGTADSGRFESFPFILCMAMWGENHGPRLTAPRTANGRLALTQAEARPPQWV